VPELVPVRALPGADFAGFPTVRVSVLIGADECFLALKLSHESMGQDTR